MKPVTQTVVWISIASVIVVLVFILARGYWLLQALILGIISILFITIAIRRRPPQRTNRTQRLLWFFLTLLIVYSLLLIAVAVLLP